MTEPSSDYRRPVTATAPVVDPLEPAVLRGVGADVLWTYVGVVSVGVTSLLVPAVALRAVGATGYGLYALIAAATSLILPVDVALSLGVSRAAARQAAMADGPLRDAEREHVIAAHSLYGGAAIALAGLTTLACAWVLAGSVRRAEIGPAAVAAVIAVLGANVAVLLATSALNGVLIGTRRFRTAGGAAVLGSVVTAVNVPWMAHAFSVPGIALAVLAGTLTSRGLLVIRARQHEPWVSFRLPDRYDTRIREVIAVAAPMVAVGVGGQVVATTDVFVLSALGSSAAVGLYRAASLVPSQIINLIFRGYDASFPALAQERLAARQEEATRVLTRLASIAAGVALGGAAWLAPDLVRMVAGQPSALAVDVLRIFAAVWCVNAAAHGLALVLIARVQQRVFAPLVMGEAVLNLGASLVLVSIIGPVGAAWASLLTIAASNLVVLPLITRRHLDGSAVSLVVMNGFVFAVLGAAAAGAVVGLVSLIGFHGLARMGVAGVGLLAAGAALAAVALGDRGRRMLAGAFHRAPVPALGLVASEVA